ncbi:hypothetical protein Ahy_A08g040429 isoform C [Arachis hypogaea]|uniref:Uncharacterized protein n=1 Tax=Arachis hypogaea TaxID=3818 RepID=A0A445BZ58_ARAHY|nr:hypothetical protein Ahy_A08g040429 isoform C [Arachis hypogaea]
MPYKFQAFIIASTATEDEMLKWYVIIQSLRESGVFSSVIASAPTLSKENFLLSIDSSNSSRADASASLPRKTVRTLESEATARRVLDIESAAFHEMAVPPMSPPEVEDNEPYSHS